MPRYGFNGEKTLMKIFILFVMRHVLDHVTLDQMGEMVLIDDNMNYFLYSESVAELVESNLLLKEKDPHGLEVYTLSPHGFDTLEPVERTLPISLRRAGQEHTRAVAERLRRRARLHTEILMRKDEPMARLTMTDGQDTILRIELVTGNTERARDICGNFEHHAEDIFDDILRVLLKTPSPDTEDASDPEMDQSDNPSNVRNGVE